ncbi:MAG: DUF1049 domain-containing protein [Pseudomonadota bacterium]
MKKLFARLIWAPVGLALVLFLVANRQLVAISFDPFTVDNPALTTPALPLWVWLILALLAGYFLGAATEWVAERGIRKQARVDRRTVRRLLDEQDAEPKPEAKPSGETLPVLKTS